jgi:hypothetical protein
MVVNRFPVVDIVGNDTLESLVQKKLKIDRSDRLSIDLIDYRFIDFSLNIDFHDLGWSPIDFPWLI